MLLAQSLLYSYRDKLNDHKQKEDIGNFHNSLKQKRLTQSRQSFYFFFQEISLDRRTADERALKAFYVCLFLGNRTEVSHQQLHVLKRSHCLQIHVNVRERHISSIQFKELKTVHYNQSAEIDRQADRAGFCKPY